MQIKVVDVFTQFYLLRCLADASPCDMGYAIIDIWMPTVHSHPTETYSPRVTSNKLIWQQFESVGVKNTSYSDHRWHHVTTKKQRIIAKKCARLEMHSYQLLQECIGTNLCGFARTRCPSFTNLRSCSDMNQAKEDTLQPHKQSQTCPEMIMKRSYLLRSWTVSKWCVLP